MSDLTPAKCTNVRPRILKVPYLRRIMTPLKRPGGVTLIRPSAFEYVCQIDASSRFHFVSPDGILGHRARRKPVYEKGQKWMRHTLLLA
jgi:hypothetical protein